MNSHWSLFHLDIVGFASALETPTLPRILAPVFVVRDNPETILLPPYTLVGDEIFNAGTATRDELEDHERAEKVTLLDNPINAQVAHDLWVDAEGKVDYAPKAEVRKAFAALFEKHLALAEEKLREGDYKGAVEDASIARAVKPGHIDPLVIRALAEELAGERVQADFTCHLATQYVSPSDFKFLLRKRRRLIKLKQANLPKHISSVVLGPSKATSKSPLKGFQNRTVSPRKIGIENKPLPKNAEVQPGSIEETKAVKTLKM